MSTSRPTNPEAKAAEAAALRERVSLMLDAFERAEPDPLWEQLRKAADRARSLSSLRALVRELRGLQAGLSAPARAALDHALYERFGPDSGFARDKQVVERVRRRGRIRSEGEYRAVRAYADTMVGDPAGEAEYLALGALLDAYTAAP